MFKNKTIRRLCVLATFITIFLLIIKKENMTLRQSILKTFYPLIMTTGKLFGSRSLILKNKTNTLPSLSFYSLRTLANDGTEINFEQFKGKKVLIVNTASDCGYTAQYEDLEKLYDQYKNKLVVIGFPSNDFKEQEKGTDEEIASFCKKNYGVTFPLMKKSDVIKSNDQNLVFQWLSDKIKNGWNDQQPTWNFSKYLVNEQGLLTHYFDPSIPPMSNEIVEAIK
jgi:glutathione peroxidase